ncbi:hypothetical protein DER46DRAFT_627643 [Fusarium sp. MPI-SDFR-AT-0072]|nr:hypothetical protein DER46DRAFT_627643 [Fusarium sp. MPI-SDFR-AT-0072]
MDGVAETGIAISDLVSHGSHGVGTFRHMLGEMIILEGAVYQINLDVLVVTVGSAACVKQSARFAMITHFQTTATTIRPLESKGAFADALSHLLPGTKNHYLAFRVDGVFESVTVRTYHTFENIRGTVIGFRSPSFMQGVSVTGDHLHFIAANRGSGVNLHQPSNDEEFNRAELAIDDKGIAAVEGR